MPLTDKFTDDDKKNYLSNFKKINKNILLNDKIIKKGDYIVYLTKENQLNLGGILIAKSDEYIMLKNGDVVWSVQIKNNKFYKEFDDELDNLKNKIDDDNDIITKNNGNPLSLAKLNNIDDIIEKIDYKFNLKEVNKIIKKFKLKDYDYIEKNEIMYDDYIIFYNYENDKISTLCRVVDMKFKNKNLLNITLYSKNNDNTYYFRIIPDKYYIFKSKRLLEKLIKN